MHAIEVARITLGAPPAMAAKPKAMGTDASAEKRVEFETRPRKILLNKVREKPKTRETCNPETASR